MTLKEIRETLRYLQEYFPCKSCNKKYKQKNIDIIASTRVETLFEMSCPCGMSSMVTVVIGSESDIYKANYTVISDKVTDNDILDLKNFLNNDFDGNFIKLFTIPE